MLFPQPEYFILLTEQSDDAAESPTPVDRLKPTDDPEVVGNDETSTAFCGAEKPSKVKKTKKRMRL